MRRSVFPLPTRGFLLCLLGLVACGLTLPASAQVTDFSTSQDDQDLLQQLQRRAAERALPTGSLTLEGPVDPQAYVVGPGDVFSIAIGGGIPTRLESTVTADGYLAVPEVGSFHVVDRTLADVKETVERELRRTYRNVASQVALAQPRQFYVHVTGRVTQPGRHVMEPVARVEAALTAAMGGASPLDVLELRLAEATRAAQRSTLTGETAEEVHLPALRNVRLTHRDGTVETVDLLRYYATGDLRFNPHVRDGDVLYVPAYLPSRGGVSVEGEVARPRTYDYREGDTVVDLLLVATGPAGLAELGPVRLVRATGEAQTLETHDLAPGSPADLPLRPRDRLIVLPLGREQTTATVEGRVRYPGTYPITPGTTTPGDLVEMAGGLLPDALLRGAYVERRGSEYTPERQPTLRQALLLEDAMREAFIAQKTFEETRLSNLDFLSRQYLGREMLQAPRLSVDLEAALAGGGSALPLRDGDRLVVPQDLDAVLVIGQVNRPGYVPHASGADAGYYVEQAGGLAPGATHIYVRDAGTGAIRPAGSAPLASGDYVLVDRRPMAETEQGQMLVLQEERERANRRLQLVQTGISVVGAVATVITTYLLITDGR